MARPNPIRSMMAYPLPSITYQRKKSFRPTEEDIIYSYNILNKYIFNNQLVRPEITQGIIHKAWGLCQWHHNEQATGSYCSIRLSDKWFCSQWFLNTLAHEMVHVRQLAKGLMKFLPNQARIWKGKRYSNKTHYLDQPWELDAFARQEIVFRKAIEL